MKTGIKYLYKGLKGLIIFFRFVPNKQLDSCKCQSQNTNKSANKYVFITYLNRLRHKSSNFYEVSQTLVPTTLRLCSIYDCTLLSIQSYIIIQNKRMILFLPSNQCKQQVVYLWFFFSFLILVKLSANQNKAGYSVLFQSLLLGLFLSSFGQNVRFERISRALDQSQELCYVVPFCRRAVTKESKTQGMFSFCSFCIYCSLFALLWHREVPHIFIPNICSHFFVVLTKSSMYKKK